MCHESFSPEAGNDIKNAISFVPYNARISCNMIPGAESRGGCAALRVSASECRAEVTHLALYDMHRRRRVYVACGLSV